MTRTTVQSCCANLAEASRIAEAQLSDADAALKCLSTALESPLQPPLKSPDFIAGHRREDRMGIAGKVESDPAPEAFIRPWIETLTFPHIAAEVARAFSQDRRSSQSSIHR